MKRSKKKRDPYEREFALANEPRLCTDRRTLQTWVDGGTLTTREVKK